MVIKESNQFPDVYTDLDRLCDVATDLKFYVEYMMKRTDDSYNLKSIFKTVEQAQAYEESISLLTGEITEVLERFKQISGIDD